MWSEEFVENTHYPTSGAYSYQGHGQNFDYEAHTGDPRQDLEYERQYQPQSYIVPEVIKSFIVYFHKVITEQNLYEIQNSYENGFNKLTDRFFKTSPWPDVENIAPIVNHDHLFTILYKELYFRHIYARVSSGPTLDQRFESYYNYCNLFNYILNAEGPVQLELPNQWLWDIIDEFIYQFQSFSIYRSKVQKKTDDELDILKKNPKIWNVHSVLNVLHSLVEKSSINRQLEVYTRGGDPQSVAGEFGQHSLYKMLGYFSLIGLLRLHCLLGDYYQGLKVLENIDFNKKNMYSRVPACQITTFYYVGFSYMMMRRYQDAIRSFSNILLYIQRTKQMFQNRTSLYDQISKMNEKMYTLLAICLVLHPMRIDESVHSQLREKFADKMLRMQKGERDEFQQCFSFCCPKFLSPVPPNYDSASIATYSKEPFALQLRVFLDEVNQQLLLPTIRSYLKLYTTLDLHKLANFMDTDEDELQTYLMCFKHKMKNVVWTKGTSGLTGEFQSASEVDFYIEKDMIHIADTKVARRYGDFFIRQIHKLDEIVKGLKVTAS
ncbi:hypothetical protein ScPMuIL_004842 [Solemya velum]